jgi:paraquat-inducible protein B
MLTETLEQIVDDIRKVDFQNILGNIAQTAQGANELINSSDMKESVTRLRSALQDMQELIIKVDGLTGKINGRVDSMADSFESTMDDTRDLVKNIDSHVNPVASDAEKTLAAVKSSFGQAEILLVELQKVLAANSKLRREIAVTLESVSDASQSVGELSDYLLRHPESIITGKK